MEIPNNFYRTAIKGLIFNKKNEFLLVKEDMDYWDLPGGAMDFGESPEETLTREIREETGLIVTKISNRPKYFLAFINIKNHWTTNTVYKVEVKDLNFKKIKEVSEIKFFTKEEALKENIFPSVKRFIKMMEEDEK